MTVFGPDTNFQGRLGKVVEEEEMEEQLSTSTSDEDARREQAEEALRLQLGAFRWKAFAFRRTKPLTPDEVRWSAIFRCQRLKGRPVWILF